ncbi:MAG: hypothetical protein OHK0039_02900 [Bacteroidia bacterium]
MHRYLPACFLLCILSGAIVPALYAQTPSLPRGIAPHEQAAIEDYRLSRWLISSGESTPPPAPVRTMAEWEEIEYLVVTWTQYIPILREIVRYAQQEAKVLILCSDSNSVQAYLSQYGIPTTRVRYLEGAFNSVWMRDYGATPTYLNGVDSLVLIDWIYNRPRPLDDAVPTDVAQYLGTTHYEMTIPPYDLVHTGGNFMSDGMGTAFSSKLLLDENTVGGVFNLSNKTEAEIDTLMQAFMGIGRYVKMEVLPYDGIHHIDMHMKLLDEETLLIGAYPPGIADGPQIEANLRYILDHYPSAFGTPYRIVRIPMPGLQGAYPNMPGIPYYTYTNAVFVNRLVLVPIYNLPEDSTALRILREQLPGYRVVGINSNQMIPAGGALHCITQAVGVRDPLLITHRPLRDTLDADSVYQVDATIRHRSGIASASIYYSQDTAAGYQVAPMVLEDSVDHLWRGYIPGHTGQIFYYIAATATNGKQMQRPMTAPAGAWHFDIRSAGSGLAIDHDRPNMGSAYPNPTAGLTCIPVVLPIATRIEIEVRDLLGRQIKTVFRGMAGPGEARFYFHAQQLPSGTYLLSIETSKGHQVQKVSVYR